MGLSIHYHGQIKDHALIEALTNEAEDICKSLNWKYHVWVKKSNANDNAHKSNPDFLNYTLDDLAGISITPEECEMVSLAFFPSGRLCCPAKLMYNNPETNDLIVETVSTKTQYAGMDVHVTLLKLLQYFKDKYFSVFELSDEGNYWQTKDETVLKRRFTEYNFLVNTVRNAFSDFKAKPGDTPGSLANRLEEFLKNKFGKQE